MKHIVVTLILLTAGLQAHPSDNQPGSFVWEYPVFPAEELQALDGPWEVYPGQLIDPATDEWPRDGFEYLPFSHNWDGLHGLSRKVYQHGTATYRLQLYLPDSLRPAALRIPEINTAFRLYLNGQLLAQVGEVSENPLASAPAWRQITRNAPFRPGRNEMVLQVANFFYHQGGAGKPLVVGTESAVASKSSMEMGSVLFLIGCLVIAGIFALGLFWFRPSDLSALLFMLFCFSYGYWVLNYHQYLIIDFLGISDWSLALRMQYLSLCMAVVSYTYYVRMMTEPVIRPWIFHTIAAVSLLMAGLVLVGPTSFFTLATGYYFGFLIVAFLLLCGLALEDFHFSHKLAWVNITGVLAIMMVIGYQVFLAIGIVREQQMITITGSLVFVFTQALALAIRFGRNYRESSMAALAAARTRDEFLNTMSHELRTPMNAILGMATFLEKSDLKDHQKDKLTAIKRNAESLMALISDILSLSEVGTGKLKLKSQPLNIESCVESAIALSTQHRNKESVNFKVSLDHDLPVLLLGDSSRIKQILVHLLSNAFKFTEEGEVYLLIKKLEHTDEDTRIGFTIVDTGVGISNGKGWAFGRFKKGEFGNTRRYGGVGLGLSVVNELVNMMNGKLEVKSKKGVGTRVSFDIKLQNHVERNVREVKSIFARNEVDTTLKVLYAEDNPVNRKLLSMMLESMGLKVDLAEDGRQAVEMAMKKYYNIIFMDIQMPEMDGLEATQRIVENSRARPIVVAVTANLAEVDKRKCFAVGMNDFLNKPVQQDELKLVVIKWQGLKKYLDDAGEDSIQLSS